MSNTSIPTFEIIRELVKGVCAKKTPDGYENYIECEYNGVKRTLWGCKYLLNQVLRQIEVPEKHKLVSKRARELWNELNCEDEDGKKVDINNCHYQEKLNPSNTNVKVFQYNGSNKTPTTTKKETVGESFVFREVFHVEHIVPVSMILNELTDKYEKNGNLTDEDINSTLDKIYVCRITKEEDRGIKKKYNRDLDYKKVLEEVYKSKENDLLIEME